MNPDDKFDGAIVSALETHGILIEEPLGEGGENAPVFRAQQVLSDGRTKQNCAVKVYRFHDDVHDVPDDLKQQLKAMQELSGSSYFVQLMDVIHEKRFVAIAMELGTESLEDVLSKREGGLSRKECFGYLERIAHGLTEAHGLAKPLYHGDIKPDNMLLCRSGVKICDFGTAAIAQSRSTVLSRGHSPAYHAARA